MASLTFISRWVLMVVLFAGPVGILSGVFFGVSGLMVGATLAIAGLIVAAFLAEYGIARAHSAEPSVPSGLERSLLMAVGGETFEGRLPKLLVYSDPSPNAVVVRSLGGRGTILLSQGMIALLNEEELRAILKSCVARIWGQGMVFQSLCSLLTVCTLGLSPRSWVHLVFAGRTLSRMEEELLSPISATVFIVLFPWIRVFLFLGQPKKQSVHQGSKGGAYSAAMQKVAQAVHIWGPGRNIGAISLYLVEPGSRKMLFSNGS